MGELRTRPSKQPDASREPGQWAARGTFEPTDARGALLNLQRSLGNRAVGGLLQRKALIVPADDEREREADALAKQTVGGSPPATAVPVGCSCDGGAGPPVTCGNCRQTDLVRQRRHMSPAPAEAAAVPPVVGEVLRSPGRRLDPGLASEMGARMGHDFGGVRLHTGAMAAASARSLGARAYTAGQDVVFGAGQFSPGTRSGRLLLAHELAHVRQQGAVASRGAPPRELLLMLDRDPDVSHGGTHTWYVGLGRQSRVFALQIGQYSDFQSGRLALRIASLRPAMENPAVDQRTMLLAIPASASLTPRITAENETRTPDGGGYEKTIEIELQSGDPDSLTIGVILLYRAGREFIPFHDPGAFGSAAWRRTYLESGFAAATDGLHERSVNFSSIHPEGSLFAPGTRWFRHPGLGMGRLLPSGTFVPLPRRPVFDEALEQVGRELVRTGIHMIPVVGTLVMIGEALVGRDIWGRQMSTTERSILGAGALLTTIAPMLRAGRVAAAASRLSRLAGISRTQALRMVVVSRSLTQAERETLTRLSSKIRGGEVLTEAEQVLANRLIGKMSERLRTQAIRAELEAATGAAQQPGRFTDMSRVVSRDEQRVGEALARDLRADVVRPPDLPSTPATRGMRNPDYFVNNAAAEAISPRTGNIERLLNNVVDKHRQAGMVVVDLTHTPVTAEAFLSQVHRLWPRPNFADVTRVVLVRETRVVANLPRPVSRSIPPEAVRGAGSAASRAARGEPEPSGARPPERAQEGGGGSFHTQAVELEGTGRIIVWQIGRQPDFQPEMFSIRFAPSRAGYRNLPADERTMALALSPQATLSPRIVEERDFGDGRRKILKLRLDGSRTELTVAIAVEETRIYVYASDGTNDIRIFFPRSP